MMNIEELRLKITELLDKRNNAPLTANEIATGLKLRGKARKKLQTLLSQLVLSGDIVRIRNNRYSLGAPADLVTGRLDVTRSGNGFVTDATLRSRDSSSPCVAGFAEQEAPSLRSTRTGTGVDVFVPAANLGTALPGDRVVVRVSPDERDWYADSASRQSLEGKRERPTGTVVRILERARRDIVGTLKFTGRFFYVVPIDPAYNQDFYVPDPKGANISDRVVVRFTGWQNRHVSPEAEVIEVIGPSDRPYLDTITIICHYGLNKEFPRDVMREAETASSLVNNPGSRRDLRDKFSLTIDPVTARDFDDALSLEKDSNGNRVLGIHIADVSHFVKPGGAMDREARARGNSVYLPDKVIPMFPEQLSNGICSLKPNEDRLAFSVFVTVDDSGNVLSSEFTRAIIRSRLRLTYEQAMAALGDRANGQWFRLRQGYAGQAMVNGPESAEGVCLLRQLSVLAQQFRKKRFAMHAMDLDVPEFEITLGVDSTITDIRIVENDLSHQLIEECMIIANEAVARELSKRGAPVIYRIHEPPSEGKIEDLTTQLRDMGYTPKDLRLANNLSDFLESIKDDPLAYHVKVAVLRSMNRAIYSAKVSEHFGLAKKIYAHFTSPIRRYPDLVLHRALAYALRRGLPASQASEGQAGLYADELESIASHCSRTEQAADEAERSLIEIKKYRFLAQELNRKKPKIHDAVVVNVMNFGMFVELLDLQVEGLVHVSAISDRFVTFGRRKRTLRAGSEVYSLGRKVKVFVAKVDFDKRQIDFGLAAPRT